MTSIIRADNISTVAGTGTVTLEAGNTLDTSAGLVTPAGHVIQVVDFIRGSEVSTTSTGTWTDTGIFGSITPTSASSKIYVLCSVNMVSWNNAGHDARAAFRIQRKAPSDTSIGTVKALYPYDYGGTGIYVNVPGSLSVLDTPNTLSQCTYEVQMYLHSGSAVGVNRDASDSNITLMEIAG